MADEEFFDRHDLPLQCKWMSDVSVPGTNWAVFVREDFWLIVETEGNEDEAEIHDIERPGREGCTGHSASYARKLVTGSSGGVFV